MVQKRTHLKQKLETQPQLPHSTTTKKTPSPTIIDVEDGSVDEDDKQSTLSVDGHLSDDDVGVIPNMTNNRPKDDRNIIKRFWEDEILMLPMYQRERLEPLRDYQYSGKDNSLISNWILQPYWKWFVTLFPLWVAPNLITLMALGWMVSALVLVFICIPDLCTAFDSFLLYCYFAICFFMYSTFDSVDGKQARRTGTSSPLGELFDHGCDSLNCCIGAIVQIAAMSLGTTGWSSVILVVTFSAFYLATWENYYTGTLVLGYVSGPTEGLLIGSAIMLVSAFKGPSFWMDPIVMHFGTEWLFGPDLTVVALLFTSLSVLFVLCSVPSSLWEVWIGVSNGHNGGHSGHSGGGKKKKFFIALANLIPFIMCIGSMFAWLYSPFSNILSLDGKATRPISMYPLFILSFGLGFSKMATNIIYSHLTKLPFPSLTVLMYPLIGGALVVNLPFVYGAAEKWDITMEMMYVFTWFVFNCLSYGLWVFHMCRSFCLFLDIWCLSIKRR